MLKRRSIYTSQVLIKRKKARKLQAFSKKTSPDISYILRPYVWCAYISPQPTFTV